MVAGSTVLSAAAARMDNCALGHVRWWRVGAMCECMGWLGNFIPLLPSQIPHLSTVQQRQQHLVAYG